MRSGAGGRAAKVNYNSACDLERFEKFRNLVLNIASAKKLAKMFAITIKDILNIIPSSVCSIFVLTPNLIQNKKLNDFKLLMQKSVLDGKYIDVIGMLDVPMVDP